MRRCAVLASSARWLAMLALCACTDVTTELIGVRPAAGRMDSGPPSDGGPTTDATQNPRDAATLGPCGDHACQCDDGIDQDGDMEIDGFDPECTGPFDDDERTFGTGRDEGAALACQDCYWDNDLDAVNDGCAYPQTCTASNTTSTEGAPECNECSVAPRCQSTCRPRAINGCDCFGCCSVARKNRPILNVRLQSSCSLAVVDNEVLCPSCEPAEDCFKPCGDCELCPGRKRRDLPMNVCRGNVTDTEPTPQCDEGEPPCSLSSDCPAPSELYYCQQGCCVVKVL
jgi:hypothetical protein